MKLVTLPEEGIRRLTFYLAMEEYLAEHCEDDLLMLWQVAPTVIFGRSQVLETEVNVDYCEQNHIQYYRRKSGGGCVYADWGNLMISYITPKVTADVAFNSYLEKLAEALRTMGFDTVKTEHNDILIGGRKVSGNALFQKEKASIVHGTLLYDVNLEVMMEAITPPKQKLDKHGIASVRQRVVNLKEIGMTLTMDELKAKITNHFCNENMMLNAKDVADIEEIEKEYLEPAFIRRK